MPLEWTLLAPTILPAVFKFAEDRAKSWAAKAADKGSEKLYRQLVPDATLEAVNATFFKRFASELDSSDLKSFTADQTQQDLAKFLSNPSVQELIQAPLDTHSTIDPQLLAAIWSELGLIPLSPDFRWNLVASRHQEALRLQGLPKGDLRPIYQQLEELKHAIRQGQDLIPGFDTHGYYRRMDEDYGKLKLDQLHATSDRVKLRDIFVPQGVRESVPPLDIPAGHRARLNEGQDDDSKGRPRADSDPDEFQERYFNLPIRPVLEVVSDHSALRAVILGGPGSGKSTLLQYLTIEAGAAPGNHPIPLLIELGKYARDGAQPHTIIEFLDKGEFAPIHLNQHEVDAALQAGRAGLLLDGLDEIFDRTRYDAVIAEIKRLALTYPQARILVTTRTVGYREQPLSDAGFRHFTLQDFEPNQIELFLSRWHRLTNLPEHEKQSRHIRLQRAIRDSAAIRELARNPLLLTMLALVNKTKEIPRERVEAYSAITDVLLHHWDVERSLLPNDPDLHPDAITLREKRDMVRLVAFHMQQAPAGLSGNLIAAEQLEEILEGYLKGLPNVANPRSLARRIIARLSSRDAILCSAGAGSYRFVHRTFLEYFCALEFDHRAVHLDKGFDWLLDEAVKAHWQDDSWHEVIRLIDRRSVGRDKDRADR